MDFGAALNVIRAGGKVARDGWNGADMHVELRVPDEHSKMRRPYLFMKPVDGQFVPWVASQTDLLANDWREV